MKRSICLAAVFLSSAVVPGDAAEKSTFLQTAIRVQSNLRVAVPTPATSQSQEMKAMEAARNQLYEIAGRECATLQQTFSADCRLTGMTIDSGINNRGTVEHEINLSLQNTYELKLKP